LVRIALLRRMGVVQLLLLLVLELALAWALC
jgi:hypothetical protein